MLLPEPDETQPQFAIRFHEAMQDQIADPYARNKACDDAWEQENGEMAERQLARDWFSPDEYQEVRDIYEFEEHTVPDSVASDGSTISGSYDRYSLAAMCDGMNARIADANLFNPLSKGHTAKGQPEPELMGYGGAKRLVMVGRLNPRFAIATDEYRRRDKLEEFKQMPGRSPEVWKYPKFEDRFFAPTAVLGTTTPRLNMPPAKYSGVDSDGVEIGIDRYHRGDETSFDEIEIDRYMSTMGGDNGMVPGMGSMGQDTYSHLDDETKPDMGGNEAKFLQMVIDGLMQTQPMQWVIQQMQSSGDTGMARPAVQQPVDPVDSLPGQESPMAGGAPQIAPAAPPENIPDAGPGDEFPQKGFTPMTTENYSRPSERLLYLEHENAELRSRLEKIEGENARERYSRQLNELSQTHILNSEKELDRLLAMSPAAAETHLNVIKENYQRSLNGIAEIDVYRRDGLASPASAELSEQEVDAVGALALAEGLEYGAARQKYMRTRNNG
jgi:hypothetical protein